MALFSKLNARRGMGHGVAALASQIQSVLAGGHLINREMADVALATESISMDKVNALSLATEELSAVIAGVADELGFAGGLTAAQKDAAVAAGIISGNPQRFLATEHALPQGSENTAIVAMHVDDGESGRLAVEAYDERDNRNITLNSIVYNLQAARQNEFGEAFFPTITLSPDAPGFGITVKLMMVYDELQRNISGNIDNFNKKNILRAYADPSILKNEKTRAIPVYRAADKDKFVDSAVIAPRTISLEGEAITTSALAVGKRVSYIGISQTDTLLAGGVMDQTDSLDQAVNLMYVYVQVGEDVLRFNALNMPYSNFIAQPQNNYRIQALNFANSSFLVNKNTKRADGTDLVTLADVVAADAIVRLSMDVAGNINIETGDTTVFGNGVDVHTVQNAAGELLDKATGAGATIAALFADAKVIGYELQAYFANTNKRQRGQLIDTTEYTQIYTVQHRAPVTALHPVTSDGQTDASDLNSLILTSRIRTSNAAVGTLLNTAAQLREYVDARDSLGTSPDVMGVGRFYVRPTFYEETIDMNTIVDSLKSFERPQDIQAALVNIIRDYAYKMYRDSEYIAAMDALSGGTMTTPTVVIGTDPVLARYLTISGDLRTLGGGFDCQIVSTIDNRMAGKIVLAFGVFNESRNTDAHPLNFGNMAWSPELSMVLPVSRGNTVSKELTVTPRFLHFVNCPIMTVLSVDNVKDVVGKVAIQFNEV